MVSSRDLADVRATGRISLRARGGLLLVALAGWGLMLVAARLEPDPRGFGTHEQLGLAPCAFRHWTGWNCPTCGMTTAWALAGQGRWQAAAATSAGGLVAWMATFLASSGCLVSAVRGRWWPRQPTPLAAVWAATGVLTVLVADWLWLLVVAGRRFFDFY